MNATSLPHRLAHPRLRSWPSAAIAAAAAIWGYTVHPALGISLTVFGIGIAFRFPDPEDRQAATEADRRSRRAASIRHARAATDLAPRGEVEVDGGRRPARMLVGTATAGTELEVVNDVDGELVVRPR